MHGYVTKGLSSPMVRDTTRNTKGPYERVIEDPPHRNTRHPPEWEDNPDYTGEETALHCPYTTPSSNNQSTVTVNSTKRLSAKLLSTRMGRQSRGNANWIIRAAVKSSTPKYLRPLFFVQPLHTTPERLWTRTQTMIWATTHVQGNAQTSLFVVHRWL